MACARARASACVRVCVSACVRACARAFVWVFLECLCGENLVHFGAEFLLEFAPRPCVFEPGRPRRAQQVSEGCHTHAGLCSSHRIRYELQRAKHPPVDDPLWSVALRCNTVRCVATRCAALQHALSVGDPFRPAERLRRRGPVPLRLLPEQPELPAVARAVNRRERVPCTPQRANKQAENGRSARRLCGESARSRCLGDGCRRHTSLVTASIERRTPLRSVCGLRRCRLLLVQ